MELLLDFGLFLAKTFTLLLALIFGFSALTHIGARRGRSREHLYVRKLNDRQKDFDDIIQHAIAPPLKRRFPMSMLARKSSDEKPATPASNQNGAEPAAASGGSATNSGDAATPEPAGKATENAGKDAPEHDSTTRKRVYVIEFPGDIRASGVDNLREEISVVLGAARPDIDEVVIRIESGGGLVNAYGLAAAQLVRLRDKGIKVTAAIDKVAASGGYLMAAVADRIVAAPFAIVGSIGVVAQIPNFHRLLKKSNVDLELHTAGEHKRTLTMFGENTEAGRTKFREELELTHQLFKQFVGRYRPVLDIDRVATGEHWYGEQAVDLGLIDTLQTSDDLLLDLYPHADVYQVRFKRREPVSRRLTLAIDQALERLASRW